jgi:PAS domain S-box-containing protein
MLRAALESTADALCVVDLEGRLVFANERFQRMWNLPDGLIVPRGERIRLDPAMAQVEDPEAFAARVVELMGDPEAEGSDVLQFRDGRVVERVSLPQRVDGRVVGRVWSFRDVTVSRAAERRQRAAEAALRRSEAGYRTVFEASNDAIYVHDLETGAILDVNGRACELHHLSREELIAGGVNVLPGGEPPYSLDDVHRHLREAATGGRHVFEWPVPRSDGPTTWLEVALQRVNIGGVDRVLSTARDISERKAAEEALRTANESLEARVEERTAELAETNLALEEEIAERARAEDELMHTAQELHAVFHALPDLYFRMDGDGTILDYRAGTRDHLYVPPEEFEGRRMQEVLPPEAGAILDGALAEVRRTQALVCVEYQLPFAEGVLDFEARLVPFGPVEFIAIVRDVTDRKRTERELQASEELFRQILANGSDLIAIVGPDGLTRYMSPSAWRLLGIDGEERLGRSSFELIHPDDRPHSQTIAREAAMTPGRTISTEFRYQHASGGYITFEALVRTLHADSAAGGLVVNARDVTARKAAEAALQASEEHFRRLIENASDVATVLDADGRIQYQSPSITRVLGYTPEELMGASSFDFVHPDDMAVTRALMRSITDRPGTTHQTEFRFRHRDGSWRVLEVMGRTLRPDSADDGVVINSRDITERRRAEEAVVAAKEEAERANRAKSEFLSRMSHELRTPMNSILGFAQVLARRGLPADQAKGVDHILRAGRHLLNLINEVLDIARIEANQQQLSLEPVKVDTAVSEAASLIRPLAAQHGCEVGRLEIPSDLFVLADRQRLAQVLLNLLSNGVKYNRPGGRVWVTCESGEGPDGPEHRIAVHDTGPGIPADRAEELFVPFARLGAESSDVEGTGLGLALSRRLVQAMGGELEVESTVGMGSTFRVRLRAVENPLQRLARREAPAAEAPPAPGADRPARLLYIEDNLANVALVETILAARPQVTLVTALQGRLGLDLARQHGADLILLDVHLPDVPGHEVLARLREDPRTARIPVVVISADATAGRIDRLLQAGAHAYLTKPLDMDEFLAVVDGVLAAEE